MVKDIEELISLCNTRDNSKKDTKDWADSFVYCLYKDKKNMEEQFENT